LLHGKLENYPLAKIDLSTAEKLAVSQKNDDLAKKAGDALQQLP